MKESTAEKQEPKPRYEWVNMEDLKKGDSFIEQEYGMTDYYIAITDIYTLPDDPDYEKIDGRNTKTGEIVNFGHRKGYDAYRCKLYREVE